MRKQVTITIKGRKIKPHRIRHHDRLLSLDVSLADGRTLRLYLSLDFKCEELTGYEYPPGPPHGLHAAFGFKERDRSRPVTDRNRLDLTGLTEY